MEGIKFSESYSNIVKKLSSIRWLKKYNINKSIVDKHIRDSRFLNEFSLMLNEKDFTAYRTLRLCHPLLLELSKGDAKSFTSHQWIKYIYEFTLSKSFKEAVTMDLDSDLDAACELYLRLFRIISELQKKSNDGSFQSQYPFYFLSAEEEASLEDAEEYKLFLKAFKEDYVYELMKLNTEVTGFNTLDHVCGVHYLALYIGRQLKHLGVNIDLGRVSGSAAGHDIGKYGCKGAELRRVPYLHYYYSDQWFKKHNINYIRNIAINHSTWDLELENLSLESLILIYSDFRVKNKKRENGEEMYIFPLKESFDVILNKLDNLDTNKEKRYKRVYSKLKDFEDFLINLNIEVEVDTTINLNSIKPQKTPSYSIMMGNEIVQNLKFIAINHNINLMYTLRDELSLDAILETARSEKDWKNLREYIRIFEEYSTYLTQKQKLQTIKFLFDNLIHPEDDIRRHSAEVIGTLIAIFDEDYRKEIPENVNIQSISLNSKDLLFEYVNKLLFPNHKLIQSHRFWLGHSLNILLNALFKNCRKDFIPVYRDLISQYYHTNKDRAIDSYIFLLESIKSIPVRPFDQSVSTLYKFILNMLNKRNVTLRLSALEALMNLCDRIDENQDFIEDIKFYLNSINHKSNNPSENMLRAKLAKKIEYDNIEKLENFYDKNKDKITDIFLSNLKTATDWINKKHQVTILLDHVLEDKDVNPMHAAIHFCNLLKVSAVEDVRHQAGLSILKIMPNLSFSERNEVAVELLRALEIEGHKFTEYIPRYLGQVFLFLPPKELDEILDDLAFKIKISKPSVKTLILKTLAITAEYYSKYSYRFNETKEDLHKRFVALLGILLNGLGDYNNQVKQSAFTVIGKGLFGSRYLSLNEKMSIFHLIAKKILTLVIEEKNNELLFLSNSAALNHIYRFISDYSFFIGNIYLNHPEKVAFFPGTFDPFSLTHKEIAKSIRDLGYEVYLAIDEFSWSKKPLPNLIRRNILNMSIASELNIYIYPDSYPTNISNIKDLCTLRNNFKDSEVYIVIGSDVLLNASSYKFDKKEGSIHSFSHIIFERNRSKDLKSLAKNIDGNVEILYLPSKYTDISSSQIRNYIDENKDISSLIDPLCQQYIYENGFYQRESLDKGTLNSTSLDVEVINKISQELHEIACFIVNYPSENIQRKIREVFSKPSGRALLLRDSNSKKIVGFSLFHWTRSSMLYEEIKDVKLSHTLRQQSLGRIILLDGLYIKDNDKSKNLEQILLTETLAFCISKDYEYALFKQDKELPCSQSLENLLSHYGFKRVRDESGKYGIWIVNMSTPSVINLDLENLIKEPFRSNNKVKAVIKESRLKLLEVLCELYPGELVLPFDINMLHYGLIKKVSYENKVPPQTLSPRLLGKSMCVPYGDILDRYIVPNTVTKSLHTEKYFETDMSLFNIGEFPHYMDLENQVKMLKSFDKPIILVDTLLHKGHRMQALDPLFKKEKIKVQKIITGILSARGKDLMDYQERDVDCVYFIPRLKIWFNENALYPFIGGDSLWRGNFPERNLLPSINLILPYTSPKFIVDTSSISLYKLSKICIENAINILSVLEDEYHILNERNLTLSSLGQVFTIPRCPDKGVDMNYDLNISPSRYLKNDLEVLCRLENIIGR